MKAIPIPVNMGNFLKMACGDIHGLGDLAFDYFDDTRRLMTAWPGMVEAGEFNALREALHRCKGGASLFGLERIVAFISDCEQPMSLERNGFDLVLFEQELSAAERVVAEIKEMAKAV